MSHNFMQAIQTTAIRKPPPFLDQYLRPLDAMLFFPSDQSVLLLSEREADQILALLRRQTAKPHPPSVVLLSLSYARLARVDPAKYQQLGLGGLEGQVSIQALVSLQLLNGETTFGTSEQREELRRVLGLGGALAKAAALCLPPMRGLQSTISHSHLEEACT